MPSFVSLAGIPAAMRSAIFSPRFRQLILWCLPALIAGFAFRAWVLFHYPYGYIHPDTQDFLITADIFLRKHHFVLHGKKAFLGPILFTLPLLAHIPPLLIIPWAQHLFGLTFILMIGEIVRLWTRLWQFWIIPATLLAAINPAMVWYEHALISEFQYIWCVTALLLAGTACVLWPGRGRFALLLLALLFTAGSRPEGKLYLCFCLLLVLLIQWGPWKTRMIYATIGLAFCIGIWFSSRNTQAGLLLYATVLPLAPDVPKSAPDFAPWIDPIRKKLIDRGGALVPDRLTDVEKSIDEVVLGYLKSIGDKHTAYGQFCQRLAIEAALHKPLLIPVLAVNKFLLATLFPPSGNFSQLYMQDKQIASCTFKDWMVPLVPRLVGPRLTSQPAVAEALQKGKLASKDTQWFANLKAANIAYVREEFPPMGQDNPFQVLQRFWVAITIGGAIGEQHYGDHTVPGVPIFFILGLLGMAASLCRPGPLRTLHLAWIPTLGFLFVVVMLTGVVNPRYRFVFEPFCILYICVLLDLILSLFIKPAPPKIAPK